jgi:hypothetical protein
MARKLIPCIGCNKPMKIQDCPPESPRKGRWGWYCSHACWYDVEGPVSDPELNTILTTDSEMTWRESIKQFIFVVISYSMFMGQWITGDKSTGAFPTGMFGACFGCMLLPLALAGLSALMFYLGVW